jgi:CubicO group peptidase (beta-lactamase class C family)
MKLFTLTLLVFCSIASIAQDYYYPPKTGSQWQTTNPEELQWCSDKIDSLYGYLETTNSKSFIVLKDGKIVLEKYMNGHGADSAWYWASAGKTVMATLIGIAQQEGLLSIEDKTSDYLGKGWTSCTEEQEGLIQVKHQLSMTTGMNDLFFDCTTPSCLRYVADAGERWSYHNGPYTLLRNVLENATGQTSTSYTYNKLTVETGMTGVWIATSPNHLFWSNTRSAARFGSLILNKGFWNGTNVVGDTGFLNEAISTSQNLNKSYGYLWWLNGKDSYMLPASQKVHPGKLVPSAPDDMYAALGKNGQVICIVPSQSLVLIRFGNIPDGSFVPNEYVESIWQKFNEVQCNINRTSHPIENASISIYPNPGKNQLSILLPDSKTLEHLRILNLQGQTIYSSRKTTVNTASLSPGLYYLSIQTKDGVHAVKRWVKH